MIRGAALWATLALSACGPPQCRLEEGSLGACEERCASGEGLACARLGAGIEADVFPAEPGRAQVYLDMACARAGDDDWFRGLCLREPPRGELRAQLERTCEEGERAACWALVRIVSVTLPAAPPPAAAAEPSPPPIVVDLALDGVSVDGEAVTLEALARRRWPPDTRAVIQADRAIPHARLIAAIDALRAAGVTRYAIDVTPAGRTE